MNQLNNIPGIEAHLDAILLEGFLDNLSARGLDTPELKARVSKFAEKVLSNTDSIPDVGPEVVVDFILSRNGC